MLPQEMRRKESQPVQLYFSPPEETRYESRLERFRHQQRVERKATNTRHRSAAHAEDERLEAQEAAQEEVSGERAYVSHNAWPLPVSVSPPTHPRHSRSLALSSLRLSLALSSLRCRFVTIVQGGQAGH